MIDALKALPIGEAYRQIDLRRHTLPEASYADLSNALTEVSRETDRLLRQVFDAIAIATGQIGLDQSDVPMLGARFEVNTHNIMSMRSRHQMDVQTIVSVLRVK